MLSDPQPNVIAAIEGSPFLTHQAARKFERPRVKFVVEEGPFVLFTPAKAVFLHDGRQLVTMRVVEMADHVVCSSGLGADGARLGLVGGHVSLP